MKDINIKTVIFVLDDGELLIYRKEALVREALTILIEQGIKLAIQNSLKKDR